MDMREHIAERTDLARIYAEDGAYNSAARVLRELTADVQEHADRIYGEIVAQVGEPINLAGSCPGHVASASDAKVCDRCGVHIDELRPDDDGDPINLAGSGPVPIVAREG